MPAMSGSYSGKPQSHTAINVPDVPGHVIETFYLAAKQTCSDPLIDGNLCVLCGTTDVVSGRGRQSGYFTNTAPDGSRNHGTFQGTVGPDGDSTIIVGTWTFTGGTGAALGITGTGTFKTTTSATGDLEIAWDGGYALQPYPVSAGVAA